MYDPELDSIGRALLDELDWHGLASVQFIEDATTDEYKLMEINSRFWASVSCAVKAGLDFPYYCSVSRDLTSYRNFYRKVVSSTSSTRSASN